jgi:hypothetical protein
MITQEQSCNSLSCEKHVLAPQQGAALRRRLHNDSLTGRQRRSSRLKRFNPASALINDFELQGL